MAKSGGHGLELHERPGTAQPAATKHSPEGPARPENASPDSLSESLTLGLPEPSTPQFLHGALLPLNSEQSTSWVLWLLQSLLQRLPRPALPHPHLWQSGLGSLDRQFQTHSPAKQQAPSPACQRAEGSAYLWTPLPLHLQEPFPVPLRGRALPPHTSINRSQEWKRGSCRA